MTEEIVEDVYAVVRNDEEQYSIWPVSRSLPEGWYAADFQGSKADCLAHVDEVWTDMRPRSLREALAEAANRPPAEEVVEPSGPDLVSRLCDGEQGIQVVLRPESSAARLAEAIDRGYVHVLVPGTDGGTELGVTLDEAETDRSRADFVAGTGSIQLAGGLTLDFQRLRCAVSVDIATMAGVGVLRRAGTSADATVSQ
ncbi:MbtH family protein [Amycolatopsis magusensis]|uniref:Uncharacterized protein YbdZ (MbtH family) n=1 Tax=Amycolatopsis magusensis TaxID=882444 RepID=A0ABS4PWH4_9PSEU|nr:MbtH family NRPS accessory protein [Amycolatopsis magusensis]MBP2182936.1 uncharacterized protein YbdZ (MbtH family) [Amycolatopsis magusensis]